MIASFATNGVTNFYRSRIPREEREYKTNFYLRTRIFLRVSEANLLVVKIETLNSFFFSILNFKEKEVSIKSTFRVRVSF